MWWVTLGISRFNVVSGAVTTLRWNDRVQHAFTYYKGGALCRASVCGPCGGQRLWGTWSEVRCSSGAVAVRGKPTVILGIKEKASRCNQSDLPPKPDLALLCLTPDASFTLPSHRPGVLVGLLWWAPSSAPPRPCPAPWPLWLAACCPFSASNAARSASGAFRATPCA